MFVIMESRYTMAENQELESRGLLPNYYKLIGMVVIMLVLIAAISVKVSNINVAQTKGLIKLITADGFILGLLFIACARDKAEDERNNTLRLKSMSFAFILTALFVVVEPVTAVLFKTMSGNSSAQGLIIGML